MAEKGSTLLLHSLTFVKLKQNYLYDMQMLLGSEMLAIYTVNCVIVSVD